jgi:hypothetical protein
MTRYGLAGDTRNSIRGRLDRPTSQPRQSGNTTPLLQKRLSTRLRRCDVLGHRSQWRLLNTQEHHDPRASCGERAARKHGPDVCPSIVLLRERSYRAAPSEQPRFCGRPPMRRIGILNG